MFSFLHKPRELSELDRRAAEQTDLYSCLAILAAVLIGLAVFL